MGEVRKVAVAGKGRLGSAVALALVQAGFETTILTRSAKTLQGAPDGAKVQEVDYDSDESLRNALRGQDAVVSTVAMSAIANQKRMIDAAIAEKVQHFFPAEATIESRDPAARKLPIFASIVDIQNYLIAKNGAINWYVVNCGALIEFALDAPFILDFDNYTATLWDGGDGALSLSKFSIFAEAVVGVLKQPERVQDHRVRVHGTTLTQNQALKIAQKLSDREWKVEQGDAEAAYKEEMGKLGSGELKTQEAMMTTLLRLVSAATFGKGEFEGAYKSPDNSWLGVKGTLDEQAIEDAFRHRLKGGLVGNASGEVLTDVADGLASTYSKANKQMSA